MAYGFASRRWLAAPGAASISTMSPLATPELVATLVAARCAAAAAAAAAALLCL